MAKIIITRPNGETEYAELTTDKALAGNDRLAVEKAGAVYYAKLDSGVSTHMYVIKPEGRKLYVQKEVKFVWKYTFNGTQETASKMVIPRTGKYKLYVEGTTNSFENPFEEPFSYTQTDIFTKGTKVINGSYIQAKSLKRYNLNNDDRDCGDEGCYGSVSAITCIEYIGEA